MICSEFVVMLVELLLHISLHVICRRMEEYVTMLIAGMYRSYSDALSTCLYIYFGFLYCQIDRR